MAMSTAATVRPTRTVIFTSQPIRCSPNKMISAPAIGAKRLRLRTKNDPTALADAPKVMKTIEKPITKASAERSNPPRGACPSFSCSTPMPESIEM